MNQKAMVITVALFILIVVGMFTFTYLKKQEIKTQTPSATTTPTVTVLYPEVKTITAKHYFINGIHTLVGIIPFPTPCDLLQTDAKVAQSAPPQITINFSVVNTAETCAQQITNQRFKVSATSSKDTAFSALFVGRSVELNIIPAAEGEKPEEFELFIKG